MARTRVDVWNRRRRRATGPPYSRPTSGGRQDARPRPAHGPPSDPLGWRFQAAIHGLRRRQRRPGHQQRPCGATASTAAGSSCRGTGCTSRPSSGSSSPPRGRDWALPYWYSIDPDDPRQGRVPPAFLDLTLADNNLQTERALADRQGRAAVLRRHRPRAGGGDGARRRCRGAGTRRPSGQATFGGGERADLSFDGGERGLLENVPHGAVHSLVGNDYDEFGQLLDAGWMGSFFTAGLDPMFWLHHANIDRLWEVWLGPTRRHVNPTGDPAFLDTTFTFPDPEGGEVTWSVGEVLDTEFLGYVYESLDAPSGASTPADPGRSGPGRIDPPDGGPRQRSMPPQVLGATSDVSLASSEPVAVEMERPSQPRGARRRPARAYLRVEGVTGTSAAPLYGVYLNVPEGADPHEYPELRAGSFSTFGLVETSQTNDQHDARGPDRRLRHHRRARPARRRRAAGTTRGSRSASAPRSRAPRVTRLRRDRGIDRAGPTSVPAGSPSWSTEMAVLASAASKAARPIDSVALRASSPGTRSGGCTPSLEPRPCAGVDLARGAGCAPASTTCTGDGRGCRCLGARSLGGRLVECLGPLGADGGRMMLPVAAPHVRAVAVRSLWSRRHRSAASLPGRVRRRVARRWRRAAGGARRPRDAPTSTGTWLVGILLVAAAWQVSGPRRRVLRRCGSLRLGSGRGDRRRPGLRPRGGAVRPPVHGHLLAGHACDGAEPQPAADGGTARRDAQRAARGANPMRRQVARWRPGCSPGSLWSRQRRPRSSESSTPHVGHRAGLRANALLGHRPESGGFRRDTHSGVYAP